MNVLPRRPGMDAVSSERRFQLLVDRVRDYAIFMLDPQGVVSSWNAGAQRFKGYTAGEIIGQHFSCFYSPEDQQAGAPQQALAIALAEGMFETEGWRVRKDGSRFWASVVIDPVRDDTGDLIGFAKITRDITDRKTAQEALRQSEERFRLLVQSVIDYAIFMLDPTGHITNWNSGAQRLKGYTTTEIVGQHFSRFYTDADRAAGIPMQALRTAEHDGTFETEGWRVRKDGSRFWASVVIDPIRDETGTLIGFAKVTRDITERKAAEEALRRALEEAERANLAKSKFLAAASHDLRQPLQSLILFTGVLKGYVHGPRGKQALAHLERGLDALKALLDSLLDVSKLDAGVTKPDITEFPINALVDEITASYAPLAASQGLAWQVEPCAQTVRSDRTLLGRLLRNLVENALRYTQRGHIRIACRRVEDRLRIDVEDTGIGIPPDHLERIFEEFHQVDNPARDRAQGLGLGLAIVRRIAHLLGHRIKVSSRPGAGSSFSLELPLGIEEEAPHTAAAEDLCPGRKGQGRLVVVVDDEAMVLDSLQAILMEWGYEVLAAGDEEQAVAQIQEQARRPNIVIADYRLQEGRTGTGAIHAVRALFDQPIPGVILTGETNPAFLRKAAEDGLGIVHKPVTPRQLSRVLDQQLHAAA
jgi:PAS domain S-box-containing protein